MDTAGRDRSWGEDMPQMAGAHSPHLAQPLVRCVRRGGERRGPASDRQIDQQVSRSDDGYFNTIPVRLYRTAQAADLKKLYRITFFIAVQIGFWDWCADIL